MPAAIYGRAMTPARRTTALTLLAAACAVAAPTGCGGDDGQESAGAKPPAEPEAQELETIEIASVPPAKLRFEPDHLDLEAGTYRIVLDNREEVQHNVRIQKGTKCCFMPGADDVGGTLTTSDITKISGTAKLTPGRYVFLCTVGGHWQQGMRGTITVR